MLGGSKRGALFRKATPSFGVTREGLSRFINKISLGRSVVISQKKITDEEHKKGK